MNKFLQFGTVFVLALTVSGCPRKPPPPPPPPPPVQHYVLMHWNAVTATYYEVYRGASPETLTSLELVTDAIYIDRSVQAGQAYFYGVKSVDTEGNRSDVSNLVVATIPN